ncbi:MAG: Gfo/Idh/MocA family oxidoreductase [Lachnospiraceae bacterium]|nr:Gfo/Idh/MocA family oxidoreductase [Lachnospiraceae bacterium]
MEKVRTGIFGAGSMSGKIMETMHRVENIEPVAIASRSEERARKFADKYKLPKAYGSYVDLLNDPGIDMVYIATPNSEHASQMKMCLEMGKAVFCEKPFTMDLHEAEEVLELARSKNLFVGEAIWTRYMPLYKEIQDLKNSAALGKITAVTANLGYPVWERERIHKPELGGGAHMDVGIYPLTFIDAAVGMDYSEFHTIAHKVKGVDQVCSIVLYYKEKGIIATILNSVAGPSDRQGIIYGTEGYAIAENINNFESIRIYNKEHECVKEIMPPEQFSGYEYELEAAARAVIAGQTECEEVPHKKILGMMEVMEEIYSDLKK